MMQIGAGIIARGRAVAFLVQRTRIIGVTGVFQVDLAPAGEGKAMSAGAGRHHAVELVDAAGDALQNIVRRADAHQIARLVHRHHRRGDFQHAQHHLLRLAHRKAADRIALERHRREAFGGADAQMRHVTALHDAIEPLPLFNAAHGLELGARALGPAERQLHRPLHLLLRRRQADTFVQLHLDVGSEQPLNFNGTLRREVIALAVDMALELHARLVQLAKLRQRHDLKATRVSQDRVRPLHEVMQPAKTRYALGTGAQHQVIGVAQHHIGAKRAHLIGVHGLDGRLRAHGHEGGRAHEAVRRGDLPAPGHAIGRKQAEGEALGVTGHRSISSWAAMLPAAGNSSELSP